MLTIQSLPSSCHSIFQFLTRTYTSITLASFLANLAKLQDMYRPERLFLSGTAFNFNAYLRGRFEGRQGHDMGPNKVSWTPYR